MKIIVAVILACSVLAMCCGQECSGGKERMKECFDKNGLGKAYSGEAMPKLSELCDSSSMKIKAVADCLETVLNDCKWTSYYNMTRLKDASSRICANRSADCSSESRTRFAQCVTEMRSKWMGNKDSVDEMTGMCEMDGGIKRCIMDNLYGSCNNGKKYLDLIQSLSKKKCLAINQCSICWRSSSSTSTISASFIVIAGFLMLSNFL